MAKEIKTWMYDHVTVERTVDGDTLDCYFDFGMKIFKKERIRIHGIDAYETRLGKKTNKKQKALGLQGKAYLIDLLEDHDNKVIVEVVTWGKYGRCVADVYIRDKTTNHPVLIAGLMVENGYAIRRKY